MHYDVCIHVYVHILYLCIYVCIKKAMNERNLSEGQWEDRKQWSLGVGQRRKTFRTRYIHTNMYVRMYASIVCMCA